MRFVRLQSPSAFLTRAHNFASFFEATENLLISALIKRDKISRTFSLHRLVQASFKEFLGPGGRQQAFNDATILLFQAFPRRDSKIGQLYLLWDRCAVYLQHIMSLKDCLLQEESNPKFTVLQAYCELSNSCQRQAPVLFTRVDE